VGKSRLVHEFLAGMRGEATIIRGRCLSYGDGITYWPLAEALRPLAGIETDDTPERAVERLSTLLEGTAQAEAVAGRVAAAIGLGSDPGAAGGEQETSYWGRRRPQKSGAGTFPTPGPCALAPSGGSRADYGLRSSSRSSLISRLA
jgi:hypothetical protein